MRRSFVRAVGEVPAVALLSPRQVGNTTLALEIAEQQIATTLPRTPYWVSAI